MILSAIRCATLSNLKDKISTHITHGFTLSCLALVALTALSGQTFAASNVVAGLCPAPGTHYLTIQAAVNAVELAPTPRTVRVCPGSYPEQVIITASLTLEGIVASGENNPVVVSPGGGVVVNTTDLFDFPSGQPTAAQILVQTPSNELATPIVVNISDIAVDGTNNGLNSCSTDLVGIYYQNASGTVNHVATRFQELPVADFGCQDGLAIYAQSGYGTGGTATVTIENSSVHDYDKNGITADGSGTVATITGNYVVGIGATPLIAQNGIQLSFGASGKITGNTVTDDVYVNPPNCSTMNNPPCFSATGILLYDSAGTMASHVTVSTNTVSNTQGAIVAVTDGSETADYNDVSSNKITTSPAAGIFLLDGIDLCSDHNTATSNAVFNSSGAGVHLDSSCKEPDTTATGANSSATNNTVNEACAGVLLGNSGGTALGTTTYNVVQTTAVGDACPVGNGGPSIKASVKVKPQPSRH